MTGDCRTYNHVPENSPESINLNPPDSWIQKLEQLSTEVHDNGGEYFGEVAECIHGEAGPQRPVDRQTAEWCIGSRQETALDWTGGWPWSEKVTFSVPGGVIGRSISVSVVVAGVKGNRGKHDHPETFVVVDDAETWRWFK
jgi:hypothetical protein